MLRTDDRARECKDCPIGHDHADLRKQVDADHAAAGEIEGEFGKPEGERRTEIRAELEFMPDGEHIGHVARRARIKQGGDQQPQQRLRQRREPDGQ